MELVAEAADSDLQGERFYNLWPRDPSLNTFDNGPYCTGRCDACCSCYTLEGFLDTLPVCGCSMSADWDFGNYPSFAAETVTVPMLIPC